ncbi:MAG: hypothetical protein ABIT38_18490 [Gemmatimonadaceae bacterium]
MSSAPAFTKEVGIAAVALVAIVNALVDLKARIAEGYESRPRVSAPDHEQDGVRVADDRPVGLRMEDAARVRSGSRREAGQ